MTSSPRIRTEINGRRTTATSSIPAADSDPISAGLITSPRCARTSPTTHSSPCARMCVRSVTSAFTRLSVTVATSKGMTAVAPAGTAPPVPIRIASPASSCTTLLDPVSIVPTMVHGLGPQTTHPSIAAVGNPGRSVRAAASLARVRPRASASGTTSPEEPPMASPARVRACHQDTSVIELLSRRTPGPAVPRSDRHCEHRLREQRRTPSGRS